MGAESWNNSSLIQSASSVLVDVGLKGVGFGLHRSDPLQDFFLEKRSRSLKRVSETEPAF